MLLCLLWIGRASCQMKLNKLTDEAERAGLQRITRLSEEKEWEERKGCQNGRLGEDHEPEPPSTAADHDSLGHYVLLLACCDSERRSSWLSRKESLLCERFIRQQFPFPSREAAQLAIIDYGAQGWLRPCSANDHDYFSCDWRRVLKLVKRRRVVVHSGIAWLRADHVPDALAEDHDWCLRHCLERLRRMKRSLAFRCVGCCHSSCSTLALALFLRNLFSTLRDQCQLLNHHTFFSSSSFLSLHYYIQRHAG